MQRWAKLLPIALITISTLCSAQQKAAEAKKATTKTAETSSAAAEPNLPSEDTVNSFLHDMFGYDPSLSYKIGSIKPSPTGLAEVTVVLSSAQGQAANKLYITPDGKHALVGDVIPFGAHPFAADNKKLQSAKGPSRGPADAPVTLVEFSDLQCPHCKEAQPKLDKFMSTAKNVRLVYQNFPLPMHDWAAKAAAYGDCVARASNSAFWKFVQGTFDAQSDITAANADEKLTAIATAAGVKGADIAVCAAKPETESHVDASIALGTMLGVNSTPTLYINGRAVNSIATLPDDVLQKLVDFAASNPGK
jgi:protein-disulfide isomerase